MEGSLDLSLKDAFLKALTESVFANLNNEQFGAEQLSEEVGLSRSQIHRKLKKINGKSITQFIREIRLEEARRLLLNETGTASEIAYQVGFGSPTYFNKCFREYYGYTPGETIKIKSGHWSELPTDDMPGKTPENKEIIDLKEKKQVFKYPNLRYVYIFLISAVIIITSAIYLVKSDKILHSGPSSIDKSIAVLPFKNIGRGHDNQILCDGMLEEVLNKLENISDLNVLSRTSVERYQHASLDIKKIGEELGVGNILEGSVRTQGEKFRIIVKLIQAETGYNLWSDEFEGTLTDTIFVVQSKIAEEIAIKLNAEIKPLEKQQIKRKPTTNYAAYEEYLSGLQFLIEFWKNNDVRNRETAEILFRESLKIDPEFVLGYSGLAEIYISRSIPDSINYYAEKILEYDPNNSQIYRWKGAYYDLKNDLEKAIQYYNKAIEISPNNYEYYFAIGRIYCDKKQDYLTGFRYIKKSMDLTIKQKVVNANVAKHRVMGNAYLDMGNYGKARQHYETSLEIDVHCFTIYRYCWLLGITSGWEQALKTADSLFNDRPTCDGIYNNIKFVAFCMSGKYSQAVSLYNNLNESIGSFGIPEYVDSLWIVPAYESLGRKQEAYTILKSAQLSLQNSLKDEESWEVNFCLSQIHAMLDEKEKALEYLSKATDLGLRWGWQDVLANYPPFKNLINDPEFKAIVKRAQEEKAAIRTQVSEFEEQGKLDI